MSIPATTVITRHEAFSAVMVTVFTLNKEPDGMGPALMIRGAVMAGVALGAFADGLTVDDVLEAVISVTERLGPEAEVSEAIRECREVVGP